MRQPNLFGDPPAPPSKRRVGPASVAARFADIARRLPATVRLGTSSWSFPGWAGIVYDGEFSSAELARHGLAAYARHPLLRVVGIDRTFYAPLPAAALAEYAAVVPEDFRFLVKAPSRCTSPHAESSPRGPREPNPTFLDAAWAADAAVAPFVEGLGPRGAALVFQLVPLGADLAREPARFAERLGTFLSALPRGPLYAVELRDRELLGAAYADALEASGATHCFNVHPRVPGLAAQRSVVARVAEARPLVARWMLGAGLSFEQARTRYEPFSRLVDEDPASRADLVSLCADWAAGGHDAVVVVNNKAEGSAPLSVFRLAEAICEREGDSNRIPAR